jgi:hypothetical protein
VTVAGSCAYYTTKGVPNLGEGPVNTINFARQLSNTSWVQYVSPNVNVFYGNAWLNMTKGPLVLLTPPIPDRYYVMQFIYLDKSLPRRRDLLANRTLVS